MKDGKSEKRVYSATCPSLIFFLFTNILSYNQVVSQPKAIFVLFKDGSKSDWLELKHWLTAYEKFEEVDHS